MKELKVKEIIQICKAELLLGNEEETLENFKEIYYSTMDRNNKSEAYFSKKPLKKEQKQ